MNEDNKISNNLASWAYEKGLQELSIRVWEFACRKHGVGGTLGSNIVYAKIMQIVKQEWESNTKYVKVD